MNGFQRQSSLPVGEHLSRRRFLRATGAAGFSVVALGGNAPHVLAEAAEDSHVDSNVLVVVELAGGNDGLNTVVPHSDPAYRKARPKLGISESDCLAINDQLGMHPSLSGFDSLLQDGALAVIQGVGYPNPNRSHFESMDIWHSCRRKDESRDDGWLGRYLGTLGASSSRDPLAMHLGGEKQPFALTSRDVRVPSVRSLAQFRLKENGSLDLPQLIREISTVPESASDSESQNSLLSFIQGSTSAAISTSQRMEQTATNSKTSSAYPKSSLGKKLETVSKLIASDLETRVYYVRLDGFDTHANQLDAHAALLREVSDAVTTFVQDMTNRGDGDRVMVMCFSEFGRRVAENASDGTDHGTAGPIFLAGQRVTAGLVGELPSLDDLDQGDLRYHTDFRSVYATLLEDWLECPNSEGILDGKFDKLNLLS